MKMIKIYTLLFMALCLTMVSCSEDEIEFYSGTPALNITTGDDAVFVIGEEATEKTITITATIQAAKADVDRVIRFEMGENNKAKSPDNFKMPMEVIMPADEIKVSIECTFFKEGLSTDPFLFEIKVSEEGDFIGGAYPSIALDMMIGFPTNWKDPTGWAAWYYLGDCTQIKYKFLYEYTGTVDLTDYQGSFGSGYMQLANTLNALLDQNPVYDENGVAIRFAGGY